MIDLTNWTYLFTYGLTLDIYGYGKLRPEIDEGIAQRAVLYTSRLRLGIDRVTGNKVISYVV